MPIRQTSDKNASDLERTMQQLTRMRLNIGIPGGTMHAGSKVDLATLGYLNETGDDELHIPARPFLVPGVDSVKDKIADHLVKAAAAVLAGAPLAEAEKGLMAAGLIGQNAVRQKITDGPFTPLSPRTLAARKAKGFKGTSPLIVTGQLRNSIIYTIDK